MWPRPGCVWPPRLDGGRQRAGASPDGWSPPRSSVRSWRFSTLPAGLRGSGSARNQKRGDVEGGQALAHEPPQFVGPHVLTGTQHHHRPDLLAEHRVGHPDHGAVGHGRVLEQGRLHLDAVDVLPTPDDHVLGPVDDMDEPLLVDAGHVAGVEPSPVNESPGRLGSVPVAPHHVGPLDPQLAGPLGSTPVSWRLLARRTPRAPRPRRTPERVAPHCPACARSRHRCSWWSWPRSRSGRSRCREPPRGSAP